MKHLNKILKTIKLNPIDAVEKLVSNHLGPIVSACECDKYLANLVQRLNVNVSGMHRTIHIDIGR